MGESCHWWFVTFDTSNWKITTKINDLLFDTSNYFQRFWI